MASKPNALASESCSSFLHFDAAYGDMIEPALVSTNGRSSEFPYTAALDAWMKRRTPCFSAPSIRCWVPLMLTSWLYSGFSKDAGTEICAARCRIMSTPMNSPSGTPSELKSTTQWSSDTAEGTRSRVRRSQSKVVNRRNASPPMNPSEPVINNRTFLGELGGYNSVSDTLK